ncbi:MAG: hypothetical protein ACR2QS_07760 [Woeseiaceae bacterium]
MNPLDKYVGVRLLQTKWQSSGKTPLAGLAQAADDSEPGAWAAMFPSLLP